jgi:hypothetical protein
MSQVKWQEERNGHIREKFPEMYNFTWGLMRTTFQRWGSWSDNIWKLRMQNILALVRHKVITQFISRVWFVI